MTSQIDLPVRPSFAQKAKTSTFLCALFLVIYSSTNALTAHRRDVGTWVYPWEHHIPFIPLMIVPYMSIDLFFIAGPFICSNRPELKLLSRRIVMAIVVGSPGTELEFAL